MFQGFYLIGKMTLSEIALSNHHWYCEILWVEINHHSATGVFKINVDRMLIKATESPF